MSAQTQNQVRLCGRVSADPEVRGLPSGDQLVTFRLVVHRPEGTAGRQRVDVLDCAVWSARLRRSTSTWRPGDVVEIGGAIRRRFYRSGGGAVSRVEIEVGSARLVRRAATG